MTWAFERQLRSTYKELMDAKKTEIESQKLLINSFSHELRNLLQSMIGAIQISLAEPLTSMVREYMLNAERCGESLLNLVNNILDSAKAGVGELEINLTEISMRDALGKFWGISSQMLRNKNLTGKMKLSRNLPANLMIDNYRLTQILMNLMGNAVKFTEIGSVNLIVDWIDDEKLPTDKSFEPIPYSDEEDEGLFDKLEKMSEASGEFVVSHVIKSNLKPWRKDIIQSSRKGLLKISITDSGCGISEENLNKLFKQFSQVSDKRSMRMIGSGLGLFITKLLCEKMGGIIKAYSKEGKGTTFVLCIPAESRPDTIADLDIELTATKKLTFQSLQSELVSTDVSAESSPDNKNSKKSEALNISKSPSIVNSKPKPRIMVVDDEIFISVIIQSFLKTLKMDVTAKGYNGLEAYNLYFESYLAQEQIDVVVIDIYMPIMDGKIAAKKIRQLELEKKLKACRIIFVSANCIESEIAECLNPEGEIRASAFLKKPVTLEDLKKAKIDEL
jgi:signal transduction histidine kinase